MQFGFCPICTMDFVPGDKMVQLGCHPTHVLHDHCFGEFEKFNKDKGAALLCPTCRVPVNINLIARNELGRPSQQNEKEMFSSEQKLA